MFNVKILGAARLNKENNLKQRKNVI